MAKRGQEGGSRRPEWFSVDRGEGGEVRITIPPLPPPGPPEEDADLRPPHPRVRLYPPAVVAVLRVLVRETRWVTAEAIAEETRLPKDRLVDVVLRQLGEEGTRMVESRVGNAGGYLLAIPDDREPAEYRAAFSAWLDAVEAVGR